MASEMKQRIFKILKNESIADNTYEMKLSGDASGIERPGQFINIKLDGFFLRRPISICDYSDNSITIIYKTVGKGTEQMAKMTGGELEILLPLGNGYNTEKSGERPLLIGGGAGVPPMYALALQLIREGKKPVVVLGFNRKSEVFYGREFEKAGIKTILATADGSVGVKGFVTDAVRELDYSYYFACGPEPMLKAVYRECTTSGQLSFEERMGCGFGACMGCSCRTLYGTKRICKDGPVLEKEEIIWEA